MSVHCDPEGTASVQLDPTLFLADQTTTGIDVDASFRKYVYFLERDLRIHYKTVTLTTIPGLGDHLDAADPDIVQSIMHDLYGEPENWFVRTDE